MITMSSLVLMCNDFSSNCMAEVIGFIGSKYNRAASAVRFDYRMSSYTSDEEDLPTFNLGTGIGEIERII